MAISASNLTTGNDVDGGSSSTTASVSPTSNNLVLLTITSRTGITANPNQPTATGLGLTWVAVNSVVYDTTSSSRKRITTLRALGTVTPGTITIDFGGQNQTHVYWSVDQVSGIDTSGTNGSGAIVQSATNKDETPIAADGTLTVTLAAFGNTNNGTFGAFAADPGEGLITVGSGFSVLGTVSTTTINLATEWRGGNDTTVTAINDTTTLTAAIGGIAIEIKAAASSLIKAVNGLAIASVKTVNGLAIASVKSINGLTNV